MRAVLLIAALVSVGCVESRYYDLPPMQQNVSLQPADSVVGDTFWLQQSVAAMHEPPPLPVRSISLGYIGDAPLSGGVMRDTPMPEPTACACALRGE